MKLSEMKKSTVCIYDHSQPRSQGFSSSIVKNTSYKRGWIPTFHWHVDKKRNHKKKQFDVWCALYQQTWHQSLSLSLHVGCTNNKSLIYEVPSDVIVVREGEAMLDEKKDFI